MGPNVYATKAVPTSKPTTRWHYDGQGTVLSCHQCIQGYNQVVMFRRLPPERAMHALDLVGVVDPKARDFFAHGEPHEEQNAEKKEEFRADWPTVAQIVAAQEHGYDTFVALFCYYLSF